MYLGVQDLSWKSTLVRLIQDGEEPLDAIKSMLEDKDTEPEWTRPQDKLEQYRL
jgi:hypothetical protein